MCMIELKNLFKIRVFFRSRASAFCGNFYQLKNMFFKVWFVAAILTIFVTTLSSGKVIPAKQCPGKSFEGLQEKIHVTPCSKSRCTLPRGTNATVTLQFSVGEKGIDSLTNEVFAEIAGVPVPFIGVDGTDACQHVKRVDTDDYVSCPLPAGEYAYTNVFPVLPVYPTLNTKVHWSLNAGKKSLICFEVPVAITSGSKKN